MLCCKIRSIQALLDPIEIYSIRSACRDSVRGPSVIQYFPTIKKSAKARTSCKLFKQCSQQLDKNQIHNGRGHLENAHASKIVAKMG